jgi:branched-chain amino acid transport system ATP-binding protein
VSDGAPGEDTNHGDPGEDTNDGDPGENTSVAQPGTAVNDADAVLSVEAVVKTFGGLTAVDGATFDVPEGSITGLIGPNGAGKTTLFDVVTGVHAPDSGCIRLGGREIQGKSPDEIARLGVGRTFQTPRVFRGMTVAENVAFAATGQTGESAVGALVRGGTVAREEVDLRERVDETLDFLELDHLADEYARGLSGGQRKLLELGRVLMLDPELIMLDEPVAGVNPALTDDLLDRLHALNDEGRTLLLIEHDMDVVMTHCDHVVVMADGRKLASGAPEAVQADEQVVEAYLGGER